MLIGFIIVCSGISFSCTRPTSEEQTATVGIQEPTITRNVPAKDFAKAIAGKENAILLDVRTPKEIAKGHMANAVFIDFYVDNFKAELEKLDKTKPILVYCRSGGRSGKTMKILADMGFKEVYNLETGIVGWKAAALPIEK